MPTGNTSDIQDGKVTELKPFALRCARGLGYCIMQRDDNSDALPAKRQPSDFYKKRAEEYTKKLQQFTKASDKKLLKEYQEEIEASKESRDRSNQESQLTKTRYQSMIDKVNKWKVPDSHDCLKKYMLKQLEESMKWDCYEVPEVEIQSFENWRTEKLQFINRQMRDAECEYQKELNMCKEQNEWIDKLYELVENT